MTLLTYHKRSRPTATEQLPGLRVVEWEEPPLLGRAERLNSLMKPGYLPFHLRARRWIRTALARGESFDVVHQPTPVAMRYPCPAQGLSIPYLIGPVGGSLDSPPGFAEDEGGSPWYTRLRAADRLRLHRDPWLRRTYEDAAVVLGIAPYVADALSGLRLRRLEILSDVAIETLPEPVDRSGHSGDVRLLYVGRLVRTKGLRDAIRALGRVPTLGATLDVVGDGYERTYCEHLVDELRLREKVRFHGRLDRAAVDDFYRRADVFVFPSYREPGGSVIFEAMAYGLPLIVTDLGGPGAATDDSCAVRVHPIDPDGFAADLAAAMTRLVGDANLRRAMGQAARDRVATIGLWDRKIERAEGLYEEVLSARTR